MPSKRLTQHEFYDIKHEGFVVKAKVCVLRKEGKKAARLAQMTEVEHSNKATYQSFVDQNRCIVLESERYFSCTSLKYLG